MYIPQCIQTSCIWKKWSIMILSQITTILTFLLCNSACQNIHTKNWNKLFNMMWYCRSLITYYTILSQKFQHPTIHRKSHTTLELLMFLGLDGRIQQQSNRKKNITVQLLTVKPYDGISSYQPDIPFIASQKSKTVQIIITNHSQTPNIFHNPI